jgi:hypothetical protein
MQFIRVTSDNANKYIGYDIIFKTREQKVIKKIIGVNNTSIKIDHSDLNNQIVFSRQIYVIID